MHIEKGQSLIEVIVAVAVGTLVVAALTFATIFSLRNANFSKTSAQATKLAQEGIERVRAGRDRNQCLTLPPNVNSWNGGNSSCPGGSVWDYQINGNCGNTSLTPPTYCYFNVLSGGELQYIGAAAAVPSSAESIAPNFKRVVVLSDETAFYRNEKKATVIVNWTDFSGPHESKLTTILRKL